VLPGSVGSKNLGKGLPVKAEEKIREGVGPFLHEGEVFLAGFVARPRGWTQQHAGVAGLGRGQAAKATAGAEAGGFALASPMALAITDRRLLSLALEATPGMGMGGQVKELAGEAPLEAVDSIEVKRLLMGKVVKVTIRGSEFKLEAGAGANAKGVAEAFEQRRAAAV
jgi:hypothetical protein